jgi:hypothetical protein
MSVLFFWVMTPCGLVGTYQRFREANCLDGDISCVSPSPHGITAQKNNNDSMEMGPKEKMKECEID